MCLLACLPGVGGLRQKATSYLRAYKAPYGELPIMSIENPTLSHFRNFRYYRHFSSLFTLSHLYNCRGFSTNQLLFMQNKPNFRNNKMNVSNIITMNYENFIPLAGQKNKPNSNPILSAVGGFQNELKIACQKIWHHLYVLRVTKQLELSEQT